MYMECLYLDIKFFIVLMENIGSFIKNIELMWWNIKLML